MVNRLEKNVIHLPATERQRIMNILERAINVEQVIIIIFFILQYVLFFPINF